MSLRRGFIAYLRFYPNGKWKPDKTNFGSTSKYSPSHHKSYSHWSSNAKSSHNKQNGFISLSVLGASSVLYYKFKDKFVLYAEEFKSHEVEIAPGQPINGLPVYRLDEVEKHKTKENKIWVTYKYGVYDVTEFVEEHPGGSKILLAAGASVEPFWLLYGVHNTQEVYKILEKYRIGNLDPKDLEVQSMTNSSDPYSTDPKRHPALIPAARKPFNAEPPPSLLVDNFYTPNELFYVRNHLPVPNIDVKTYKLEVTGLGVKTTNFSLKDIKKFPKHSVTTAVQCAGNRRSEMTATKPVKGLNWNHAAIGNATWSGARLIDVLKACGFKNHPDVEHVQFEGHDMGPDELPYGASVPAKKVFDPYREVILAYEMNGKELPRDHGYPLRIIIPGIVGARNVKWLKKIILSDEESESFWQQSDYKVFSPSTDWDDVDFTSSPAIQELPVNSAICVPEKGEKVQVIEGSILVKGYAWSGGGNRIVRVDVSTDQGKTWHVADLEETKDKASIGYAWTLWSILVPVDGKQKQAEIWVKAVDASNNTQPESFENIWNLRGLLANAYHKIKVDLVR